MIGQSYYIVRLKSNGGNVENKKHLSSGVNLYRQYRKICQHCQAYAKPKCSKYWKFVSRKQPCAEDSFVSMPKETLDARYGISAEVSNE